jgi:hypothetical protein
VRIDPRHLQHFPEMQNAALAQLKALADAGAERRAIRLVQSWLSQAPGVASLHQAHLHLLREVGAGPAEKVRSLRALEQMGQLQSWRDIATLAEIELDAGDRAKARKLLAIALSKVRGLPGASEAREVLRALLPRTEEKLQTRRTIAAKIARAPKPVPKREPTTAQEPAASPVRSPEITVPIHVTVDEAPGLVAALSRGTSSLSDRALALRAHRIAVADHFGELLCLSTLRGVERMPHQIDTVKRALRVLRGRALLADEVGLGKTIEAAMFFAECRLRGLCETALILAPAMLVGQWRGELEAKLAPP